MGVWDLNEVYCLKTGLAAWPSCSSKNWLRNSVLKLSWQLPLNSCPGFWSPRYSQLIKDWPLQLCRMYWNVCISICPMHCVYVLSGLLLLHLVPSQHSRGLSGRRKPIRELAEPLELIQPLLEKENRALTQLTLSQNLHKTAQDTKTTPGSSALEELVVYISLPKFSMTQWFCNTWFNLQQ